MICEGRRKVEEEEEDDDVEMWWMKLKCWLLPLRLSALELSKRKSLMTNDCRLSNTALECDINKAMHAGSGGTWQWSFLEASLFINIPTHLFIYNKTPKFEYLYYDFLKHYIKFNNLYHFA